MRQKSELTDAVGNADEHHAFLGQFFTAVVWIGRRTGTEPAAVNPDEHGNMVVCGFRGRPDIQIQAVFAHPRTVSRSLNGRWAELGGLLYAFPFRRGPRISPAEITHWWRGKRDAPVNCQPVF